MTNAQLIAKFSTDLIARVAFRMEIFGDDYAKAKRMIELESVAGPACWALVDAHFATR